MDGPELNSTLCGFYALLMLKHRFQLEPLCKLLRNSIFGCLSASKVFRTFLGQLSCCYPWYAQLLKTLWQATSSVRRSLKIVFLHPTVEFNINIANFSQIVC
jgi:hypothetical protein